MPQNERDIVVNLQAPDYQVYVSNKRYKTDLSGPHGAPFRIPEEYIPAYRKAPLDLSNGLFH